LEAHNVYDMYFTVDGFQCEFCMKGNLDIGA